MWTPESSKPVSNKEFQNFVKNNNSHFNQLQLKSDSSTQSSNCNKLKCFDCGKEGEQMGHKGCTQPDKKLHVPMNLKNCAGWGGAGHGRCSEQLTKSTKIAEPLICKNEKG